MAQLIPIRRVTVIVDMLLEQRVLKACFELGVKGYTSMRCHGQGRHAVLEDAYTGDALVRLEFLVQSDVADKIVAYLSTDIFSTFAATVCVETVEVARSDRF